MNYKTVVAFGPKNISYLMEKYENFLIMSNLAGVKRAHIEGIAFGYVNCTRFVFQGVLFYLAALVIDR